MPAQSPASPARWLRAAVAGRAEGVDRPAKLIRGFVVAQEGPFKSAGRGEFDRQSLETIVSLMSQAPKGLKSRLGHPTMSEDGIGKFLGRAKTPRMSTATDARTGKTVAAVRADLHLDPSAHTTPHGDLATYVMDLAESDPDALSSSLVLETDEEYRRERDGTLTKDANGEPLPPLWRPTRLHASDIVDTGDAVDGLLSADQLTRALSVGLTEELRGVLHFDNVARLATQLLDGMFGGLPREQVDAKCKAWLARYLELRFPVAEPDEPAATPALDARRARLEDLAHAVKKMRR